MKIFNDSNKYLFSIMDKNEGTQLILIQYVSDLVSIRSVFSAMIISIFEYYGIHHNRIVYTTSPLITHDISYEFKVEKKLFNKFKKIKYFKDIL